MENQLSNFELDLLFISASFSHCGDYKEQYWHKLEERLNRIENNFNKESTCGKLGQSSFMGTYKLKCKFFKK